MPAAISPPRSPTGITRFTGGYLVKDNQLVEEDLWISSRTGKILRSQEEFFEHHIAPDRTVDLQGKILCPGFIDVQFNGAFGFDFSNIPEDMSAYQQGLWQLNHSLVHTGVTSYLPTLPSQLSAVYHKALPYLGPSGASREARDGSESLGAHCEGPFISPTKNGIHSPNVLLAADDGLNSFQDCYGASNLNKNNSPITLITAAPEVPGVAAAIPELAHLGIRVAIGHTEATYEEASTTLQAGATMITHLFNAMRPLHHRNPGIFGLLGQPSKTAADAPRPFFGIIADGIHLHPTTVKIAWTAHPDGLILVTDAMKTVGLPDGTYDAENGDRWVKKGSLLVREGTDTIAGSSATLGECVRNLWAWSGAGLAEVLGTVTGTPARMLGLEKVKGSLEAGADADLVVLDAGERGGEKWMEVEEVWKFGSRVHQRGEKEMEKVGVLPN